MKSPRGRVRKPPGGEMLEERCVVLCARVGKRVSAQEAQAIGDVLVDAEANGWWFLSPGTAIAVFISRKSGAERAADCEAALRRLAATQDSLAGLDIGIADGMLAAAFTRADLIESMPVGEVVAQAVRKAMRK